MSDSEQTEIEFFGGAWMKPSMSLFISLDRQIRIWKGVAIGAIAFSIFLSGLGWTVVTNYGLSVALDLQRAQDEVSAARATARLLADEISRLRGDSEPPSTDTYEVTDLYYSQLADIVTPTMGPGPVHWRLPYAELAP